MRLVKEQYVPLAVDGRVINKYHDSEVDFLRELKCVANGAHGEIWVISAGGKRLERGEMIADGKTFAASLQRGLKTWAALPAAERKPGGVQVPERGAIDPKRAAAVAPPEGALIVRVYNRQLGRDAKGELRYTVPEDYIPVLRDPALGKVAGSSATRVFSQPANDMMWVTKAEWQAMMPPNPKTGQSVKVPVTLTERIFRFQLDPGRGLGEGDSFDKVTASAGQLRMTVENVSGSEVRLRLEGSVELVNPRKYLEGARLTQGGNRHTQVTQAAIEYRPSLLGYIAYDPARKVVTRFDMVALGDVRGRPVDENLMGERIGAANLLGVAFELVPDPKPADFLSPKGLRDGGDQYNLPRYLCEQPKR